MALRPKNSPLLRIGQPVQATITKIKTYDRVQKQGAPTKQFTAEFTLNGKNPMDKSTSSSKNTHAKTNKKNVGAATNTVTFACQNYGGTAVGDQVILLVDPNNPKAFRRGDDLPDWLTFSKDHIGHKKQAYGIIIGRTVIPSTVFIGQLIISALFLNGQALIRNNKATRNEPPPKARRGQNQPRQRAASRPPTTKQKPAVNALKSGAVPQIPCIRQREITAVTTAEDARKMWCCDAF